ncbi:hypothetical protein KSP40_PGU017149 [Platanthera guangdongensis]|uniref:HMA domain-containing protein n=1 Tax=Platanthera guangdongensis TaxID=2320717 RepID=A0ABR2LN72_9ASPA
MAGSRSDDCQPSNPHSSAPTLPVPIFDSCQQIPIIYSSSCLMHDGRACAHGAQGCARGRPEIRLAGRRRVTACKESRRSGLVFADELRTDPGVSSLRSVGTSMGEEAKQEEAVKGAEAPPAPPMKQEEKPAEEKKEEEKKEEAKPSPPPPIVLFVGLHCVGCAKKIERTILKCKGVEAVETNIEKNEVIVRGDVDPQALCAQLRKKTSRNAKLLSPLPPPPPTVDAPDAKNSESKAAPSQVSGVSTVELLVNMHCEACAQQLRKKILKMKGVQVAETDLNTKKVTVMGTMNEDKLVEYIHRRTGKFAKINPPAAPVEEKKADDAKEFEETEKKIDDEKATDQKNEEVALKKVEANKEEKTVEEGGGNEPKKEEQAASTDEEMMKRMVYWNGSSGYMMNNQEDDMGKRVVLMHHWMPMPMPMSSMLIPTSTMYPLELQPRMPPPPPPQLFSDENPNACCIS